MEHPLTGAVAEITSVTSDYEGYTFFTEDAPTSCGAGHDTSLDVGDNAPSDAGGGAFYHSVSLANGESADQEWTCRKAGGSFTFSGRVASRTAMT